VAAGIRTLPLVNQSPSFTPPHQRNNEELTHKASAFASSFMNVYASPAVDKLVYLLEISATEEVATHMAFYESKLSQNGGLLAIPTGIADGHNTEDFHKESEGHAARARKYILDVLPKYLPNTTLTSPHG
jgi:hypothetical protein